MVAYSKYKAVKTEIDGHIFDSKKEARRYLELKILLKSKKIKELELQPKFLLQEKFKKNNKNYRKIEYIADFKYFDVERQKTIIEDVKGVKTEVYKIKKKIFEYKYPELTLNEI